ncbi:MAG: fructosamine kinase family protein [Elainella sp.]
MWDEIAAQISRATQQPFQISHRRSVGGGSVNQAYAVSGVVAGLGERAYFVKLNQADRLSMFEAEALSLQQIAASQTVRVPQPICWGLAGEGRPQSYLVLEWLELGYGDDAAWSKLGQNLAAMHRVTAPAFGWQQDNTIGFIPQRNRWTADWSEFFLTQRLGYQFELAQQRGGHFPHRAKLLEAVPQILADHQPLPSLVHGDLWTGNAAITQQGEPVIFDPALYFGDREVDLAMSQLFGSFPTSFYQAYQAAFPLSSGYEQRQIFYNLYHILNHFNQFGGSYEAQANRMIAALI